MKKKGSAILTVIGSITVLVIIAFAFISSSREKKGFSKLMSDEKKAEALAESATDYIIKYIKKNANIHEDSTEPNSKYIEAIYYLLRAPLTSSGASGDNFKLDVTNAKPVEKIEDVFDFKKILESSIKEINWEGKVDITSRCELVNAEYFTPVDPLYKITTINQQHLPAEGKSAKFLDDDTGNCSETNFSWVPSNWELRLKFPSGDPLKEKKSFEVTVRLQEGIPLSWISKDKWIDLIITRKQSTGPESLVLSIDCDTRSLFGEYHIADIDIQEKMNKVDLFPNITPKTLQGLKNGYSIGGNNIDYDFSNYVSNITRRKKVLSGNYSNYCNDFNFNDTNFGDKCYYIEKGGILRITTNVKYKDKNIEKSLVTEIPFKVSDIQPIAPEYSLFLANTELVSKDKDPDLAHQLGEPFDLNNTDDPTSGSFIVHNVPYEEGKINYQSLHEGNRVAGMIRINSEYGGSYVNDEVTKVRSFLGLKDMPESTEANKFCTPFNEDFTDNKFNTRISFRWDDITRQRYHELEFPLLYETKKNDCITGLKNVVDVLTKGGNEIISVPTLLFGIAHMEYPLGIRPEGPIDTIYSRTVISCRPDAAVDVIGLEVHDKTDIAYVYEPVSTYSKGSPTTQNVYPFGEDEKYNRSSYNPALYGMQDKGQGQDFAGYNYNQKWDSNTNPKYLPANCYDTLQYAKKATRYYDTVDDFKNDLKLEVDKGGLKEGDHVFFKGVYYIKLEGDGKLEFDEPLKYRGNGLIVCKKGEININRDITRVDDSSTLGIIARTGQINFNTNKVMASCFSNFAPFSLSDKLEIYGNLVCNNFERSYFSKNVHIYYDNTICNVTPFASLRKIGKFEPKRYAVTFADNWSKYTFEKPKDKNNQP